ncbi:MAG: cytochrome P450 [Planctomycetota bacterium]
MTALATPPGPTGLPFLGNSLNYARDPLGTLSDLAREYGDIAHSRYAGADVFLVVQPAAIEHVLVKNRANYQKDRFLRSLRDVLGDGLLTSEGERWKADRKLMAPAFTPRRIHAYAGTMVACAREAEASWEDEVDVTEAMTRLTLEVAVRTLFGTTSSEDARRVGEAFRAVAEFFGHAVSVPLPVGWWSWIPTRRNTRYRRARRELEDVVARIVRERRADPSGDDLLSAMLAARDEEGRGLDDGQLRDQVLTLLLAGHETTSLLLTYVWDALARNPAVEARLHAELEQVLGGRDPELADLERLPYLRQVVQETLRLYPPAAIMGREAIGEDEIQGYRIPQGSIVLMSQWVTQRDPRFFPSPHAFDPERWAPGREAERPRFAYFPFGGGQRICIGEAFAMLEARLVIATLAQRRRFVATSAFPPRLGVSITLRPRDPVRMQLPRRG